jgi:hypothetical protein
MFGRMGIERKRIIKSVIQLVYFMRGAIAYKDMMLMSLIEREMVNEFIEGRLDLESKKTYPIY